MTGSHPRSGGNTDTLCVLPWIHLSTTVDGVWGRCCFDATNDYDSYYQQAEQPAFELVPDALGCLPHSRYAPDNPDRAYGLSEAFNSPNMRRTRLQMLASERPDACRHCYQREDDGLISHRQAMNERFASQFGVRTLVDQTSAKGELQAFPVYLDLRFGNTCNLACIMCSFPVSSKFGLADKPSWTTSNIDPYRDDEAFWDELASNANLIRHIYFAGGEPFMQSGQYSLIDLLVERGVAPAIELHYNSNLTILPTGGFDKLKQFKKVEIAASCDGVGQTFERIRVGGRWPVFAANVREAKRHVEVWLDVSVQRENLGNLAELIAFARAEGVQIRLENFVDFPVELSARSLSAKERQKHCVAIEQLAKECQENCEDSTADQLRRVVEYVNSGSNEKGI